MNEERLKTCINLFNSIDNYESYVKSVMSMMLLLSETNPKKILTELDKKSDDNGIIQLQQMISNGRGIKVDEIQKMLISLSALFISLHKESILEKDSTDKSLTLLVNGIDYDALITYIAQEKNNKYYITNIEFDTSLECLDFIRNKLLHGDYHIKDDHIYVEKDGKVGSISYQRLIDFCFKLPKIRNCKGKSYTVEQVLLSPFEGFPGEKTTPIAERLFETKLTITVKGKRKIDSKIISLLDEILEAAYTYNIEDKYFVGEALDKAFDERQADIARLKCKIEYTSVPYLRNPKAKEVLTKLVEEYKLIKHPENLKDSDFLNYITTNTFNNEVNQLHHSFLGLAELTIFMTPTALAGVIPPQIKTGEFAPIYNDDIPLDILKFYCYYNYGLDAIFSKGVNTNLRDILNGTHFDYSIMDLTMFDDPNMTVDFKLNNYQDQLNALIQEQAKMVQVYNSKLAKYNAFKSSAAGSNQVAEQKILAGLQTTKDHLDELNDLLNKANNFDLTKYEKNLNIMNHIRNSIAHGHYSIDDSNPNEIYFNFDDIYQGVNTYHLRIKKQDFESLFGYKQEVKDYLENLSKKELTKSMERVHNEDLLLNCQYVLPSEKDNWNTLVENTLDMNNPNEINKLLFAYEIMREITMSSLYVYDFDTLLRATEQSFHNFIKYACVDLDKYLNENGTIKINGRNVTKEDYEEILKTVFQYCEVYKEYGYDIAIENNYLPTAEDNSILKNLFPEKSL